MNAPPMLPLPAGITQRVVADVNGLRLHLLEAGAGADRPLLLLLHGFPELAFSWRKVMVPLAEAGFHVVAPDQRGYGGTLGWDGHYGADVGLFTLTALVRDMVSLVCALGHLKTKAIVGHDFGSPVAAACGYLRPDLFPACALMSAPVPGIPRPHAGGQRLTMLEMDAALATLPRPRKHYQVYYATADANGDMLHAPQGLKAFLRAYYHVKSADWPLNDPQPLADWTAQSLAALPTYYVMDREADMPATVGLHMPSDDAIAKATWLSDSDLAVYAEAFNRTGFQGGLNWYRAGVEPRYASEAVLFAGQKLTVPTCFIAGAQDWGIHQRPGSLEAMKTGTCPDFRGLHLVPNAGHWVQQERPDAVVQHLLAFLKSL